MALEILVLVSIEAIEALSEKEQESENCMVSGTFEVSYKETLGEATIVFQVWPKYEATRT